jgi:hypothetical protein
MNNTNVSRAIARMEDTAQELIAKAEVVLVGTTEWSRKSHRTNLLEAAREYAKAVDSVRRTFSP